jgi:hypothetical protein
MTSPTSRTPLETWKSLALWGLPLLVSLLLYWPGLTAWFQRDDFAWLGLRDMVHGWHDLGWALFAPLAQGTIRTLSERVVYLSFFSVFGMNALPYRMLAFLTHFANLTLLSVVTRKLTGSRAAGFWAAIIWTVNCIMAVALAWTAIYYELLCSFSLLLSLWFLIRYSETGERRFYLAQWVTFLLGFGILELTVVYPALAAVYVLCRARHLVWKIAPMFLVSAAYSVFHLAVSPLSVTGPYKMYWDFQVFNTLLVYAIHALGPSQLTQLGIQHGRTALALPLFFGLGTFFLWKLCRREWIVVLFPAWFVIVLSPLLPLRDHVTDYYLTIPLIGLSMLAGWALVSAWDSGAVGRMTACALAAIYFCVSIPVAWASVHSYHDVSMRIKTQVLGVVALHQAQPGKVILLKNVDPEMFSAGILHHPFRLFGFPEVYVLPENKLDDARDFTISTAAAGELLAANRAAVYDLAGPQVKEITADYRREAGALASKVDVGEDSSAGQLGPEWYPKEGGFRWMPKRATVQLMGPERAGEKLYVNGYLPPNALASGPVTMNINVDAQKLPAAKIDRSNPRFQFVFDLPESVVGKPMVEVGIELDRTFRPPNDKRDLGAVFGSFEIR